LDKKDSSYRQIIRSTGIFGGAQVMNMLIGIVRNKLGALLLGRDGIGLIGIYQNIIDLVRLVSNLGINTMSVRDIVAGADDSAKQARVIAVFRWWLMLTSCLGSLICLTLCYPLSVWWFKDGSYTLQIALLSAAVFFVSLSGGQSAILQGLRNIPQMAKSGVYGNAVGLVVSVASFYCFGLKGIVPAFVLSSIIMYYFTDKYVRRLKISPVAVTHSEALKQGGANLKLGLYIASVGIVSTASMFLVRLFLTEQMNFAAVGTFNAVWTISFTYPALILQSMSSDYYPRLCSVSHSAQATGKLVNEQTYIAMVMILPVTVIMMLFSKYVLYFLYAAQFMEAATLLQWQIAGGFFKVLSWALAFIVLAKGKGSYHLAAEIVFYIVYLGGGYALFSRYGLVGFGMGYLAAYIVYLAVVFAFGVKLSSFRWSGRNILMFASGLLCIAATVFIQLYLNKYLLPLGIAFSVLVSVYAAFMLSKVLSISDMTKRIREKISGRNSF
jgi:PST family polysaccharide transporter